MSKKKFPIWSIPYIALAVIGVIVFVWVKSSSTPVYTYPKQLSSYTNKVTQTADDVASGFLRAIYTEDEKLLKECTEDKLLSSFPDIKETLKNANKDFKSLFGENWYEEGTILSQNVENGAAKSVSIKFGEDGKEVRVYSMSSKGKYTVFGGNGKVILTKFKDYYTGTNQ
ncbi:hypothetical protein SDC9_157721 [bioreactor metagenome]|uniref:Uncharacterized protein n=1 Tax=bioreactor metagenome TaxID=1076179 RepID=A0A645F9Y1_9ZZZZ